MCSTAAHSFYKICQPYKKKEEEPTTNRGTRGLLGSMEEKLQGIIRANIINTTHACHSFILAESSPFPSTISLHLSLSPSLRPFLVCYEVVVSEKKKNRLREMWWGGNPSGSREGVTVGCLSGLQGRMERMFEAMRMQVHHSTARLPG